MKIFYLLISFAFLGSCFVKKENNSGEDQINEKKSDIGLFENHIILDSDTLCFWNIDLNVVEYKDELKFKELYIKNRELIAELIKVDIPTRYKNCSSSSNLSEGDVVFLIMQSVEKFNFKEVTGLYYDSYKYDCPYPDGLFSDLHSLRNVVVANIKEMVYK